MSPTVDRLIRPPLRNPTQYRASARAGEETRCLAWTNELALETANGAARARRRHAPRRRARPAAFSTLYDATSAKLYGVILRILRRRDVADEVCRRSTCRCGSAPPSTMQQGLARHLDGDHGPQPRARRDPPQATAPLGDAAASKAQRGAIRSRSSRVKSWPACASAWSGSTATVARAVLAYREGSPEACPAPGAARRTSNPGCAAALQLQGCVASREGLPPFDPVEGTPLELPAFFNKKRAVWRVSRQRGAGLAPLARNARVNKT